MMKIEIRDPIHLKNKYTPALRQLPELPEDSEEFRAFAAGLKAAGFIRPILLDEEERVLDDHSRTQLRAALRWQLKEVPVQVCRSADAPLLLIHSLAHVRHLSKSAIAYLAVPHLEMALEAARRQKLEMLRKGQEISVAHSVRHGEKTTKELAEALGISDRLFDLAIAVHKEFKDAKKYEITVVGGAEDGAVQMLTLKEHFEPKLLRSFVGGEHENNRPMGLGGILAAIPIIKEADKQKFAPKAKAVQLEFDTRVFVRSIESVTVLKPAQKQKAIDAVMEHAETMSPEDCEQAAEMLRELAKIYAAKARENA